MEIPKKLQIIQQATGLTQTQLAQKLGVSFVSYNRWATAKVLPRAKAQAIIDELFLEVTGQKIISLDELTAKKSILAKKSEQYKSVISEILNNPDIRDTFLLKLTYNSNKIEGSTLTEPDTAAILFDNVSIADKSVVEHLEAKNHQTALQVLFEHVAKKEKLDTAFILKLHGILMNGILSDAGHYRNHAVRILGVNLAVANYVKIPELMSNLFDQNEGVHTESNSSDILSQATAVHSSFEKIHPFADGNGRIGRILLAGMLLQTNMPPAIIKQEQKRLYYTYLYKAQTTEDQSLLENFLCDATINGFSVLERNS